MSSREAEALTYPMSFEQESIWLQDQFEGRSRYLESWIHRLHGPVATSAVGAALTSVVSHQEALRSRLDTVDGRPVQTVLPPLPVPVTERWVTPDGLDAAVLEAVSRPVPLDEPPLLRATLLRVDDTEAVLALSLHHAVMDGWSVRLLDAQFSEAYRAAVEEREPRLPELALQFGPYAERQRHDDEVTSPEHLEHWRTVLTDAPAESTFPSDRPRPARPSHRGGEIRFEVDPETGTALRRFARSVRATPFVVLAAALTSLLSRSSGQQDVVLGTPISRRTGTEVKSLLGCLTDVMPLRQRLQPGESFRDLVASVKSTVWAAVRHRHIPYGHLVREFVAERTLGRFPLFQIVLTLDDELGEGLTLPGVESERLYRHAGRAKFDVFLNLVPQGDGYRGFLEYAGDVFDADTARRIADRFTVLLADAVRRPDTPLHDLRMMPERERSQVDAWARGSEPPAGPPLVHTVVHAHAAGTPDRPAAVSNGRALTYRELDEKSDAVAAGLVARGCAGRRVALCVTRSLDLPVLVLGVLKAGAACLPLDPAGPADRTAFILHDAEAHSVIADAAHADALRRCSPVPVVSPEDLTGSTGGAHAAAVTPDTLAYVLYTSGSTGRPKGVGMPHRSLANLVGWQRRDSACGPGARTLQFAPLTFDVAFQEIFATWAAGGTLILTDDGTRRDPGRLLDLIREERVERLVLPFVALRQLAEHACADGRLPSSVREVLTSGEQLHITPAIREFFTRLPNATLQNQYGPTETHVVTALRLAGPPSAWPDRPSIGRPVDGAEVRVRDGALRPQPIGVPGEICVGGAPVACGYVGHAAADGDRFTDAGTEGGGLSGFDARHRTGGRLYRTGDLGRLLPDGTIEYLGRDDDQVKIRGYRVELTEAEAAVKQVAGVFDAIVLAQPFGTAGDLRLVAHYIPAPDSQASPEDLRARLANRLPAHLVPAVLKPLAAFPLTTSGKVDRAALARQTGQRTSPESAPDSADARRLSPTGGRGEEIPRTATEGRLAKIWGELLGPDADALGRDEDFFRLGGDSLLGARLMLRLREEFGVRLGLDAVYASPTIAALARLVDSEPVDSDSAAAQRATTTPVTDPRLPADIVPSGAAAVAPAPQQVLLTGATGFLGVHVLRELLARTDATVHCLIRARDDAHAPARLEEAARRFGAWSEGAADRIKTVAGDLSRSALGLDPHRYGELARVADAIYHVGASVNLALPYAELEAANVMGTIEVLRLAAAHRTVPVHHVSTVGVFSGTHLLNRPVTADEPLTGVEGLHHGYAQSKWAAERLVQQAGERGLPVTVYRPTRISGPSDTGICQTGDFLWVLLKGCIQAGLYPADADVSFDLVPVDYVSAAIVALSLDAPSPGRAVHLADGAPLPMRTVIRMLSASGYTLKAATMRKWAAAIEQDPDNAAFPLLGVMAPERISTSGSGAVHFDGETARKAAAAHGVTFRPLDDEVFERHIRHFVGIGFLPEPR